MSNFLKSIVAMAGLLFLSVVAVHETYSADFEKSDVVLVDDGGSYEHLMYVCAPDLGTDALVLVDLSVHHLAGSVPLPKAPASTGFTSGAFHRGTHRARDQLYKPNTIS